MPDPKGKLVTPVGFRSDGSIHSLALDASDRLIVLIDAVTSALLTYPLPHGVWLQSSVSQIVANATPNNAESTIYTTPSGHDAYITSILMALNNASGSPSSCQVLLYNTVPSVLNTWYISAANNGYGNAALTFAVPLHMPSGYKLTAKSPLLNAYAAVSIAGYVI